MVEGGAERGGKAYFFHAWFYLVFVLFFLFLLLRLDHDTR